MPRNMEGLGTPPPKETQESTDYLNWLEEDMSSGADQDSQVSHPQESQEDKDYFAHLEGTMGSVVDKYAEAPGFAPETTPESDTSTQLGAMVRSGADRVATFIDNKAETYENGKAAIKKAGGHALRFAKRAGIVLFERTALTVESGADSYQIVRQKVISVSQTARQNFAARRQARVVQRQEDAFASYEPNIKYVQDHEEALAINEQKKADQESALASYEDNVDFSQKKADQDDAFETYADNIAFSSDHGEALEMEAGFEEERRQARIKAEVARRTKALRKAHRREKVGEAWNKIKSGSRRFGRAALKTMKRAGKAIGASTTAAASAAKKSWQETAQ